VEALARIRERESAVDEEIRRFEEAQKKALEKRKADLHDQLEGARKDAEEKYATAMAQAAREVEGRAKALVKEAEEKASRMKFDIGEEELRSIVERVLSAYLKE